MAYDPLKLFERIGNSPNHHVNDADYVRYKQRDGVKQLKRRLLFILPCLSERVISSDVFCKALVGTGITVNEREFDFASQCISGRDLLYEFDAKNMYYLRIDKISDGEYPKYLVRKFSRVRYNSDK